MFFLMYGKVAHLLAHRFYLLKSIIAVGVSWLKSLIAAILSFVRFSFRKSLTSDLALYWSATGSESQYEAQCQYI